jgi:hypothetical protein
MVEASTYHLNGRCPKADVEMAGGEALIWYSPSETARRAFCGTCGARVLKEITAADRWLISAGLLDAPVDKRIIKNLWGKSQPDWYDIPAIPIEGSSP